MNTRTPLALSFSIAAFAAAACTDPVGDAPRAQVQDAPAATQAVTPQAGDASYSFSQDGSSLGFVGAKVTGKHEGSFKKLTGTITGPAGVAEKARIDVVIDMASVTTDSEKLTGHLQSADFFDVAKFPTARFTSASIEKTADGHTVHGDLTLHGVTKRISFPARVTVAGDDVKAQAEFGINRQDFGVVYPGKPDDLIRDEVLLKLDINAKRAAG